MPQLNTTALVSSSQAGAVYGGSYSYLTDGEASDGITVKVQGLQQNEIQSIAITGTPTGGTFTLTFDGQETAGIAFDATAGAVDTALELLSNIGVGDVTCTGGPLPGTAVICEFTGALVNTNVAEMVPDSTLLTGGTSPTVAVTTTQGGRAGPTADLSVFTVDSGLQFPAILVLTNVGLVTTTDDDSRVTWGFVLDATTTHQYELLSGDSHVVRLSRDFVGPFSIFAKAEVLPGGVTPGDMDLDIKVWDQ